MSVLKVVSEKPELPAKRVPTYAGQILLDGKLGGDFDLPGVLLGDAVMFLKQGDARSLRASVFSAFAALEAFPNQLSFFQSHHAPDTIGVIERDIMDEMVTVLERDTGELIRKRQLYSLDERFLFLFAYFHQKRFDKGNGLWQRYKVAKDTRDHWTHPKPPFSLNGPSANEARRVIEAVAEMCRALVKPPYSWMWPFGQPT